MRSYVRGRGAPDRAPVCAAWPPLGMFDLYFCSSVLGGSGVHKSSIPNLRSPPGRREISPRGTGKPPAPHPPTPYQPHWGAWRRAGGAFTPSPPLPGSWGGPPGGRGLLRRDGIYIYIYITIPDRSEWPCLSLSPSLSLSDILWSSLGLEREYKTWGGGKARVGDMPMTQKKHETVWSRLKPFP